MARSNARKNDATLSVKGAFVVHLASRGGRRRRFRGRVEHLVSGEVASFSSLRGLLDFFDRLVAGDDPRARRLGEAARVAQQSWVDGGRSGHSDGLPRPHEPTRRN
jgi:hypothetical protein